MSTPVVAGIGAAWVAIAGFFIAVCRSAGKGGELTERALRQERAVRAGVAPYTGNVTNVTSHSPPAGADAPRAPDTPPQARGATTSRRNIDHEGEC